MPHERFSPSRLRTLRERAGVSRMQLAYEAHRTEQSVWLWERGTVTPSIETLANVAACLGVSVGDFFESDGAHV